MERIIGKHENIQHCVVLASSCIVRIWKRKRLIGKHENTQHVALLPSYWYQETETRERLIITHGQDLSYKLKMDRILYENANKV